MWNGLCPGQARISVPDVWQLRMAAETNRPPLFDQWRETKMSTTAPAKAAAQRIIVLCFPNLSFDILSRPGTGGTRRRTKTRTRITAMVNGRAILLEFDHYNPCVWRYRRVPRQPFGRKTPKRHVNVQPPGPSGRSALLG
jgi:hypothetical protein